MPLKAPLIMQMFRQFRRYYNNRFGPFLARTGLTRGESDVLLFLANNPELDTARDVAEFRELAKSQVSQAVELLAGKGLLLRTPDGGDRRVVHLSITEAGRPLAREAQKIQRQCVRELLAGLTAGEHGQLTVILEKMMANADALERKDL